MTPQIKITCSVCLQHSGVVNWWPTSRTCHCFLGLSGLVWESAESCEPLPGKRTRAGRNTVLFPISRGPWSICRSSHFHSPYSSHQDSLKTNLQNMTCSLRLFHWFPITCRIKSKLDCGLEGPLLSSAPPASTTSSSLPACFLNSGSCSLSVPWVCQAHFCILSCREHWLLPCLEFHVSNTVSKRPSEIALWSNLCPQPLAPLSPFLHSDFVFVSPREQELWGPHGLQHLEQPLWCPGIQWWVCELCAPETDFFLLWSILILIYCFFPLWCLGMWCDSRINQKQENGWKSCPVGRTSWNWQGTHFLSF